MREAAVYSALLTSAQGFVPDLARQLTGKATNQPKLLLGTQPPFTTSNCVDLFAFTKHTVVTMPENPVTL